MAYGRGTGEFVSSVCCVVLIMLSLVGQGCSDSKGRELHNRVKQKIIDHCVNSTDFDINQSHPDDLSILDKLTSFLLNFGRKNDGAGGYGGDGKSRQKGRKGTKHRRLVRRSMNFIYPGTKWCGAGDVASGWDDLGVNREADICCRNHDHCPQYIEAYQTDYGLTNPGMFTRSCCGCDEKFKECLHKAKCNAPSERDRYVAGLIGEIYFSELNMKCIKFPRGNCPVTQGSGKPKFVSSGTF
ncbi:phospholipase A2 phaiodactylipin-like [Argonauta hians]